MGQLPHRRVTPSRPFFNSGVDFAGPFTLKSTNVRGAHLHTYKGYIAAFVCLSTGAVHLEAVTEYTAEGFVAAYKRFTGRRGICSTISSDQGTNFVGADRQLREMFTEASRQLDDIRRALSLNGTTWKWIPPGAPHFGGKWESTIKSVKFHLRRIIGTRQLTYEELSTFLVQTEAILNSRPIAPASDDPLDPLPLTPGHFLSGGPLTTIPEPDLLAADVRHLPRWQVLTHMTQKFWERWSKECLQRFQSTSRWKYPRADIRVGSLVLVSDERYPPCYWPLARVIAVHPGPDGLIRVVDLLKVVDVKTNIKTEITRPIHKVCLLPVDTDDDDEEPDLEIPQEDAARSSSGDDEGGRNG